MWHLRGTTYPLKPSVGRDIKLQCLSAGRMINIFIEIGLLMLEKLKELLDKIYYDLSKKLGLKHF